MNVLIVESNENLAQVWARHLKRQGGYVKVAKNAEDATQLIEHQSFDVIVLDLVLESGSAFAVSDVANFRQPQARVVFVTNTNFFSDGSIFRHSSNACAFVPSATEPHDLAALVEHHAQSANF